MKTGEEINEVSILAILFTRRWFLLIDEPTNHLDMDGRKIVSELAKGKHFNMFC